MSLRRRLAVVLVLGLSALVIAVIAIIHLLASTNAARERAAEADAEAGAQALAERVDPGMLGGPPDGDMRGKLQGTASSVLRPLANAAGGYCMRNGAILAMAGRPGRGEREGPRHAISPEVQDAVSALCAKARPGAPAKGRIDQPRSVSQVAAVAIGDRGAAWFLTRTRTRGGDDTPAWPFEVVLLAIAAAALAGFTIDAMIALRRGADQLSGALVQLSGNLRAPVPRPRASELRDIAAGLSAMAAHLADARDRERALEAQLARDQRLTALGRVVAGVAHEVRNPLAGMKLRLDLLARSGGLDTASREDVGVCLGEIARLNRLVESLLTVSRAKTLNRREIALGPLADERIARAVAAAQRAEVRLERHGDALAVADPDALAAAVDNLLRNAIEASPRGAVVIVRVSAEQGVAMLDVEDAGPGIPEARRAELFEPFFTTKPEGTGLGLWISRLLLEAKGATLGYDRIGDRTRMRITFSKRA
ncbi:sensor histidine kinase [Minicystis rosea]|nr:sensor histidine kinase [Minicystis rosea]